jgi:hypothetical protein
MKTEYINLAIRDIINGMKGKDCGSSSCLFAERTEGQRNNCDCSCLDGKLPRLVRVGIIRLCVAIREEGKI